MVCAPHPPSVLGDGAGDEGVASGPCTRLHDDRPPRVPRPAMAAAVRRGVRAASTFAGQGGVPPLPVPSLPDTMTRYLRTLEPLFPAATVQEARALAKQFVSDGSGVALQRGLVERAAQRDNWLEEWWDGGVYTQPRLPLPINYNYFLRLKGMEVVDPVAAPVVNGVPLAQVARAAQGVACMTAFRAQVESSTLPPDTEGGRVVDMNQYARLFGHGRIARLNEDALVCFAARPADLVTPHYATTYAPVPGTQHTTRHVAVTSRGHWFAVPVLSDTGVIRSASDLAHDFCAIALASVHMGEEPHPIAALTTMDRDEWARQRASIRAHSLANARSMDLVDSAQWVVNLDEWASGAGHRLPHPDPSRPFGGRAGVAHPARLATASVSSQLSAQTSKFLVGRGDGVDRWFDKHQFIVGADGSAGMLMEHAPGDGLTALRLINYMVEMITTGTSTAAHPMPRSHVEVDVASLAAHARDMRPPPHHAAPFHLPFDLPASARLTVAAARSSFATTCSQLSHSTLHVAGLGGQAVKEMKVAPDAFAQMAIQLAHHHLFGFPAPTYESTTTRGFRHGRTETTRSCSVQSQALVHAIASRPALPSAAHDHHCALLLRDAAVAHVEYARAAKAGMGVDRHLLGLANQARLLEQHGAMVLPPLFTHPTYAQSRHWRLSTSHCGSAATSIFGFGPVVDDGFGVAYFVSKDASVFNVTAWAGHANVPRTAAADFTQALDYAMHELARVGSVHAGLP